MEIGQAKHMKRVYIFHHYATLPNLNGHIRPYMFAKYLRDTGAEITIFASSYQHFSDENLIADNRIYIENNDFETKFVFVRTPSSFAGKIARIRNLLSFYQGLFSCTKVSIRKHGMPDIILASSPNPLSMVAGIKIAKKFGTHCINTVMFRLSNHIWITSSLDSLDYWMISHGQFSFLSFIHDMAIFPDLICVIL